MSSSRWYQWLRRSVGFSSPSGAGRLRPRKRRGPAPARRFSRPKLEALEDRLVPSGYDFGKIDDPNAVPGPNNNPGTIATGINDSLEIVGQYSDANGAGHSFLFAKAQYTTLPDHPQAGTGPNQGTYAVGISPSGEIVGFYIGSDYSVRGFLLVNGQYTTLDHPNAGATVAEGINASGQIVGYYLDALGSHGFLLSAGQYATLDDPNGGTGTTYSFGINASGQIVGAYGDGTGVSHGFLLVNGQYTTLDDPNAVGSNFDPGTQAYGINDSGQIVGRYTDATSSFQAFILSGGQYTTIDNPNQSPVGYGGAVQAINNTGQIVGFYTDSNDFLHGYAANPVNHGPVAPASEGAGAAAMSSSRVSSVLAEGRPFGRRLSVSPFGNVLVVSPRAPLLNAEPTAAAPFRVRAAPKTLVLPGPIHRAVPQDQSSSAVRAPGKPDAAGKALDRVFANFHGPLAIALSDDSTLA